MDVKFGMANVEDCQVWELRGQSIKQAHIAASIGLKFDRKKKKERNVN